ncbi:WD repeat-containing protein 64 [Desmophyllum pertusum]|uniref:WD repeat-containing protein 64 n=1 Tax=Desmophyllum pertusum TaxID=174260 RepID=A0A9W9ZW15_9CNID|nr:WD repeat-containing protein 64 [Desmophyllum pertusum]
MSVGVLMGEEDKIMEDSAEVATLIELKVLTDLFIPPVPSHIDKDEQTPFISRAPLRPLESHRRCEPPRSRSANSSNHRHNHRDDQLVYTCLYLVHRVRKPIIYGKGNTQLHMSSNERDQDSANTGHVSDTHHEEQDGTSEQEEGENTVQSNQEPRDVEYEENKESQQDEEMQAQEEAEEHEDKIDNEDIQDGIEETVNEEAVFGAFLQVSEPALVTAHHDGFLRFWNLSVRNSVIRDTCDYQKTASAVTSMCTDPDCNFVISGDARGYITVWDVGNFLLDPPSEQNNGDHRDDDLESNKDESKKEPKNVIKQVVCWRGHLTRVVGLEHVQSTDVIVSASTDCSVRVWYRNTGHFIGFFKPASSVAHAVCQGPIKTLKNMATKAVQKATDSGVDCPLMFDDTRWLPFRHSAQRRQNPKETTRNSLILYQNQSITTLISKSTSSGSPETGAVYRALPVYKIETPERLKTPAINMQSSWLTNQAQNQKGHGNKSTFAYRSSSSTREPVVSRFPHIVQGHKR